MPDDIVIDAHGGWNPRDNPAYTFVPKGTTVCFYTENMKILPVSLGEHINQLDEFFRSAEANQTVDEYKSIQNYGVSQFSDDDAPPWVLRVQADTYFCTDDGTDPRRRCEGGVHRCTGLFSLPGVVGKTVHFSACRYVEFTRADGDSGEVGGLAYYAETGVNTLQTELGHDPTHEHSMYDADDTPVDVKGSTGQVSYELYEDQIEQAYGHADDAEDSFDAVPERMMAGGKNLTEEQRAMMHATVKEWLDDNVNADADA